MELTQELLAKAKNAESAEALEALAKENGWDMTQEEAKAYFTELHKTGALSDRELENVTGGGCRNDSHLVVTVAYRCDLWECKRHPGPAVKWMRINGDFFSECGVSGCGAKYACKDCHYCRYERGLWLCYNPKK